jgi:RNA polymerase sigma-70 factor (ECF subfamily)
MLHAVAGFKHREIAGILELPLSTVLSKYNRALKKLKSVWEEADAHA